MLQCLIANLICFIATFSSEFNLSLNVFFSAIFYIFHIVHWNIVSSIFIAYHSHLKELDFPRPVIF